MLTAKQLVEQNIITNVPPECIAQVGIDLQVRSFSKVEGVGFVPKTGKTQLPNYRPIEWDKDNCVTLAPGCYEVVFEQGCEFPADIAGSIIHRSSVLRCGNILMSAEFDPGFQTENIGSFITILNPIRIEKGARLAQIICHRTEIEATKYQGQWQCDCQRAENVEPK